MGSHHVTALRKLLHDDPLIEALQADPASAPLGSRSRAFVDYAILLARSPGSVGERDIAPLRNAGLSDRGIHDLAAVAAYYNVVNRIALGLGVDLEEERPVN